jgi:DNA-binding winged helix-turn-helix (wHTH) protein/tetratricopeptide (TPR) repeat protein/class 3 adenylate cyclase
MIYRFGDYELDTQLFELRCGGLPLPLEPKVFDLLAHLIRYRDRVVTKQELLTLLWPHQSISDAALSYCVMAARKTVGDSGRRQQIIRTLHERGYRFVAAVDECLEHNTRDTGGEPDSLPKGVGSESQAADGVVTPGGSVSESHGAESAEEEAWEPKLVTVLAIDAAWPQAIERDPLLEVPWAIVRRWQHAVVEKIQGFGALVAQRASAPIIAVFGMPRTIEQMPQRAVQAALALRQLPADGRLSGGESPGPEMRMAIHTGHVLVDVHASDPNKALLTIGDTLSRAVRLLGHAAPGEIILSPQVGGLVEGWFELRTLKGLTETGSSDALGASAVVGLRPRRSALEVYGKRPLSRFVGRVRELAELRHRFSQVEKGRGHIVGIVGEPGVGKSRLCYEVSILQRARRWLVLETSPVAYGKGIPYLPVVDLLKAYFRLGPGDTSQTIHGKILSRLESLDEGLRSIASPLCALLDLPVEDASWQTLDPSHRRQFTLDALKSLLVRESQVQPVLLIVENLHWIDTETQAFLDGMVNSLPTAHLLLLVNYRPEYQHSWGMKPYYTPLRLDPLGPERAAELLRFLIGEDATLAPLSQHLIEKTEGNPFFLEESVRTLVEAQVMVGAPGSYRLAPRAGSAPRGRPGAGNHQGSLLPIDMQVPATVQAVLATRIDALAPEDKRLLQMAAVIGAEVPFMLLRVLADQDDERLQTSLSHLQGADFLYETSLFPELTYTFKHALTHEVAYSTLLPERRRPLHARIVEILEIQAGDRPHDQVERLAHHALRGQVWEKVVRYAHGAGTRAAERSAYGPAGTYFDQALDALVHLPDSHEARARAFDLYRARQLMHAARRELEPLLACSEKMLSLAESLGDPHRLALALTSLGNAWSQLGDNVRALELTERGLALAETVGAVDLLVQLRVDMGMLCRAIGDYRRGATVLTQAAKLLWGDLARERLGRPLYPAVVASWHLATCLSALGEFRQALRAAEEGLQIAETLQQPGNLLFAYLSYCEPLLQQGQFHDAVPRLERAMALHTSDQSAWYPMTAGPLGFAYAMTGRLAEALPLLEQAVERAQRVDRRRETQWRAYLSEVYLRAGRLNDARVTAERLLALGRERSERSTEARGRHLLGEIAMYCDPMQAKEAEAHYRQALAVAEELGMRPLQAHCHHGLGSLYAKIGQQAQARVALSTAIGLYRAMEMLFWLPQAEAILALTKGVELTGKERD